MTRWNRLPDKYNKKTNKRGKKNNNKGAKNNKTTKKNNNKAKKLYKPVPSEEEEQLVLAEYLDIRGFCWCHVPNEGKHKVQYYKKRARLGVKPGFPDIQIFDYVGDYRGVAIELKRAEGGKVRDTQKDWLKMLKDRGWLTKVCEGANEAIIFIEGLKFKGVK